MQYTSHHTDGDGGEQAGLFEQHHTGKTEGRPCQTVGHAHGRGEQEAHQHHPDQTDGNGFPASNAVEHEHDDQIGKADLYALDGHQRRDQALHIGQNHGQGDEQAQKGHTPWGGF